jgi:negative regulator of replication initiation
MKQLLLRVPDELHQRLADRARHEGRSVNVIATEMLDTSVAAESGSARDVVRARAAARGLLATVVAPTVEAPPIEVVVKAFRKVRLTAAELIDEQRGTR